MKDDKSNHDPIPATKILAICDTEPIKTVEDTYIYENIEPHTLLSLYDNIETSPITATINKLELNQSNYTQQHKKNLKLNRNYVFISCFDC